MLGTQGTELVVGGGGGGGGPAPAISLAEPTIAEIRIAHTHNFIFFAVKNASFHLPSQFAPITHGVSK
jgi:hypothetical protein